MQITPALRGSKVQAAATRLLLVLMVSMAVVGCKSKTERDAEMNAKVAAARAKLDAEDAAKEAARVKAQEALKSAAASAAQAKLLTLYKSRLFDPGSAEFRGLKASANEATNGSPPFETLCGEVNAKNRLSGYVGFARFAITAVEGQTPLILTSSDDGVFGQIAERAYTDQGCTRD